MKPTILKSLLFVVLALGAGRALSAQDVPPALFVEEGEKHIPMLLSKLDVGVRIFGSIAETRMTMTFTNPTNRQLAGDLYFPLSEGAFVSGYALDVNGRMIDGVVVEKARGRQVFEALARQRIDPGLVEWIKGNNFKTRVFPIPPNGARTVMVRTIAELVDNKEGTFFVLPLNFKDKVKEFHLKIEVLKSDVQPQIKSGGFANFQFKKWREAYLAEVGLKDSPLAEDLIIALPEGTKPKVMVEKAPDGTVYFLLSDHPQKPAGRAAEIAARKVVLFWDASLSRGKAGHQRELEILRRWLLRDPSRTVEVDLVFFRNEAEPARPFIVKNGNAEALLAALRSAAYDGGTQLGAVRPTDKGVKPDLYLLFTDGLSNFGREEPPAFNAPLFIFSEDSSANHSALHALAGRARGEYYNLKRLTDDQVLSRIGRPVFSFLRAEAGAGRTEATYPRGARPAEGRFLLAGRLIADEAAMVLHFGTGGESQVRIDHRVRKADAVEGELLKTFWAQKKIEELMIFAKTNEQELLETGQTYGLVAPGTSLIVLDSLEQYLEYEIAPPASLPEWRQKYFASLETRRIEKGRFEKSKMASVLKMWNDRIAWWATDFSKIDWEKLKKKKTEDRGDRGVSGGVVGGVIGGVARQAERPVAADARMAERADVSAPSPEQAKSAGGDEKGAVISILPWDPKTPYIEAIRKAGPEKAYAEYLAQGAKYGSSPGFYLDCADHFFALGRKDLGLRILTSIAELELENGALLRILAHRLEQLGRLDLSAGVFEEVLKLRPEEPQSWRDLALVLASLGKYERSIELLNHVVMAKWDRFPEIEVIALMEMNAVIAKAKKAGIKEFKVAPPLIKLLDVDVRIILTWDADMTDIDLWVIEPTEEKAYYDNNRTTIGGLVSRDVTDGYGPEEYLIRKAMRGKYKVQINYFGERSSTITGPVTIQVDIFTNYGRPNEQHKAVTLRLKDVKETVSVTEIDF